MLFLGLAFLITGLVRRWPPGPTVVAAAFIIAAGAGMSPLQTLELLGKSFAENRMLTLFLLTLPALGLCEQYGLHAWAGRWIRSVAGPRTGGLFLAYQIMRILQGALGVRINGHASFVRPLLAPMAEATSKEPPQKVLANCAAVENLGNFYGQNLNPVQPSLLLVLGVMKGLGVEVELWTMAVCAAMPTLASLTFAWLRYRKWD